jgi:hypothetical protein
MLPLSATMLPALPSVTRPLQLAPVALPLISAPWPDPPLPFKAHLLSLFSCIRLWRNRLRFFWLSNVAIQYFVFLLTDCAYSSIEWPL